MKLLTIGALFASSYAFAFTADVKCADLQAQLKRDRGFTIQGVTFADSPSACSNSAPWYDGGTKVTVGASDKASCVSAYQCKARPEVN